MTFTGLEIEWFEPMLDQYIGECMVSIIKINNGIVEPTYGHQNCYTSQILIFGGYLKVRESLHTRVTIWVNTISNHIDTTAFLPRYQGSCMVYRPKWYRNQKYHQIIHTLLVSKNVEPSLSIPKWYQKQMIPVQHWFELIKTSIEKYGYTNLSGVIVFRCPRNRRCPSTARAMLPE